MTLAAVTLVAAALAGTVEPGAPDARAGETSVSTPGAGAGAAPDAAPDAKEAEGAKEDRGAAEKAADTREVSKNPPLEAGEPPHPPLRIFADIKSDVVHLFSWENGTIIAGGGAIAALVHDRDPKYTRSLADSAFLRKAARPGEIIGSTLVEFGLATSFYAFGRMGHRPRIAHIGWDLMRSQIVSQMVTQTIKFSANRERPDGEKHSFPSGHASTTLASASVLHQHYGWKVGLPAYSIASYVALSRLPSNRHYLGDVVFGSAIGIIAGRTVTLHERAAKRIRLEPAVSSMGAGVEVVIALGSPHRPDY